MNPVVEFEKSFFVKCSFNETNKYFEGAIPRDMVPPLLEKELSVAGISFQPALFTQEEPIEIGLSFAPHSHTLLRLEKGGYNFSFL